MKIINCKHLTTNDKIAVLKLWNEEYPLQLKYDTVTDLDNYLAKLTKLNHFLLVDHQEIFGWAFTFNRDLATWFVIILSSSIHQRGFGSKLLTTLMHEEPELNGWVVDQDCYLKHDRSIYKSPVDFYSKHGFIVEKETRLPNPELSAVKIKWEKPVPEGLNL